MNTILISPADGETVDLCALNQREFDACVRFRDEKRLIRTLARGGDNQLNTTPSPVLFEWETDYLVSVLEISQDSSFAYSVRFTVRGQSRSVFNLKKDTVYYWRVNGCDFRSFVTDGVMPRWIAADGIVNARDIGGRVNSNGARIRQGLVYRGPRMENDLTDKGREQLLELGIRAELDLRKENGGADGSVLGESVRYVQIAINGYDEFIRNDIGNGTCRRLMEFLADPGNYPLYFHCYGGADRTGTLAFLLDSVLGLDDEQILKEYELTMLSSPDRKLSRSRKGKLRPFLRYIGKNGKRTASLSEKTRILLKNAGVGEETVRQLRENLLETN